MHTYWLLHRYQDALATSEVKAYVAPASLVELGRIDEARGLIAELEVRPGHRVPALLADLCRFERARACRADRGAASAARVPAPPQAVRAFIDGRHAEGVRALTA